MEHSDEELKKLEADYAQYDQYMDTRAEELLDHDPELVKLYHYNKKWKLSAMAIQRQLIELIESDFIAQQIQSGIRQHKDVVNRVRENPEEFIYQGIASDCAEAIEKAGESLKLLSAEIQRQISELPPLNIGSAEERQKVEKAGLRAMLESSQKYL